MTRREARDIVVGALVSQIGAGSPLLDETPLFDGGLSLDSIQFLETVLAVEREAGLVLRGEDLTAEVIATVGSMTDHVHRLCGE